MSTTDVKTNTEAQGVYCICRSTECNVFMIMCDYCSEWYHGDCIGITLEIAKSIDKYCCWKCSEDPPKRTTYKSTCSKSKNKVRCYKRKKVNDGNDFRNLCENVLHDGESDASYYNFEENNLNSTSVYDTGEIEVISFPCSSAAGCYEFGYSSNCKRVASEENGAIEKSPQQEYPQNNISAIQELYSRKLLDIGHELYELKRKLEAVDIKTAQQIEKINNGKREGNSFIDFNPEDTTPVECILCGVDVDAKTFRKHLEVCSMGLLEQSLINELEVEPCCDQWNVFCNYKISRKDYCKQLRFLCSLHYKYYRGNNERCGYPLIKNNEVRKYCGNIGKTCSHEIWEERIRLKFDLEKINLIVKFNKLTEEQMKIRKERSSLSSHRKN